MTPLNRATKSLLTVFALTGVVAFSSCSKDDDDTTINPDASVKIVNAFPNAGAVNVYNGNEKINPSSIGFGEATGYLPVAKGKATYIFKTTVGDNNVLSYPVEFDGGSYSLYATGTTDDNTTTAILAKDDLAAPASGKAKIRLVQASQDAPSFNFILNDSAYVRTVAYKTATPFQEVTPGTYTIKLNNATNGETTVQKADVTVAAGKIYTVVAQGLVSPTPIVDQAIQINVVTNN